MGLMPSDLPVTRGRRVHHASLTGSSDKLQRLRGPQLTLPVFRKVLKVIMSGAQAAEVHLDKINVIYANSFLLRLKRVAWLHLDRLASERGVWLARVFTSGRTRATRPRVKVLGDGMEIGKLQRKKAKISGHGEEGWRGRSWTRHRQLR